MEDEFDNRRVHNNDLRLGDTNICERKYLQENPQGKPMMQSSSGWLKIQTKATKPMGYD